MSLLTTILLVPHIIFAGLWISEEAISIIMVRLINRYKDTPAELTLTGATLTLNSTIGQISSAGLLITGALLTWSGGMVILSIGGYTPLWLFIKQIVYILITILVIAILIPASRRLGASLQAQMNAGGDIAEMRLQREQLLMIARIHALLVLTNIILAVWKPTL